jgi:uncharacterized protein YkwD
MKICRFLRTAAAATAFCFVFFHYPSYSQDRSPNRPSSPTPPSASRPSAEEKLLFDAANRERAMAGLQALRWDSALAAAARQHVQVMVHQNLLLHQCLGEPPLDERAVQAGAKFSLIAENIAVGPSAESIHDGWMHSTGHRKNILSADITAIGIAVMRGTGGLFAVQDFSRPVEVLSLREQEEKVIQLLKATNLRSVEATEDARKTCGMDRGFAGAPVLYVIRFEVTELNKLPNELLQKIGTREYRKASVGACSGGEIANFTRYRVAVMLN